MLVYLKTLKAKMATLLILQKNLFPTRLGPQSNPLTNLWRHLYQMLPLQPIIYHQLQQTHHIHLQPAHLTLLLPQGPPHLPPNHPLLPLVIP